MMSDTNNPAAGAGETGKILPSGAVVQETGTTQQVKDEKKLSRRGLLGGVAAGAAGGLVVGGLAGGLIGNSHGRSAAAAAASASARARELTIIYGGDICDAPAIVALEKGFFADRGLDVTLHKTVGDEDIKAAVGSGTYDASSGIFYSWLKPVEQGQNVKFVAGLHSGCLRLLVRNDSDIKQVADLRGRTIGVPSLSSSATMFFSLDLVDAGINPAPEAGEVQWKVYESSLVADALKNREVDAIATSDPIAYRPIQQGYGWELASNMTGPNAQDYCCCTALNGDLVKNTPDVARALVEAWAEGSRYVPGNENEVAHLEVDNGYIAGDVELVETLLAEYGWEPSVTRLRDALMPGIEKFRQTGYLDADADTERLADKAFDTLGLDW
ncbi:ABC-type taurine transport system, periplasmic component [Propionibacterium australiense]|nr:Twin arginine translocation (Tat) signal profile [Propionibacterium australiense]VEH89449.1 ABC-type taurine transport system, periplasmic component [Propionibacterium australiense]